ncbi:MAG: (d)CMP kinase [Planctomycetes bacterium]|nr:(d)CMP kinase [Planctomycetota bacterium]MCP4838798.1 (d)CMP kinase [Planctomycetota bacterium]
MAAQPTRLIVTIDGPAGTGKSAVSGLLADRLGIGCLDTGAMYRSVALLAIRTGSDPADAASLLKLIETHDINFDWDSRPPVAMIDGAPVEEFIRSPEVGQVVSIVAAVPAVRAAMVEAQRRIAEKQHQLVSEGRDQGSVVFPDAEVRFFMTADVSIRAARRVLQLQNAGKDVDPAAVRSEIDTRDAIDSSRSVGPLMCPVGAIQVDTSNLTLDEVVDRLETDVRTRLANSVQPPC